MRIRFGTRGFLLLIAVILAGSYFGYRYYYWNHKVLGVFTAQRAPTVPYINVIEFQSTECKYAVLRLKADIGSKNSNEHDFKLLANKRYMMFLRDGVFYLEESEKPQEIQPLEIYTVDENYRGLFLVLLPRVELMGSAGAWQIGTMPHKSGIAVVEISLPD